MSLASQEHEDVAAQATDASSSARAQMLQGEVIRDLKRRYKVGLFQEAELLGEVA